MPRSNRHGCNPPKHTGPVDRLHRLRDPPSGAEIAHRVAAPRQRAVIELRHFQDLSYEEIATTLGIPLSDVKSDLFRARQHLRKLLAGER